MIKHNCSRCGNHLESADDAVGREVVCDFCFEPNTVPEPVAPAVMPPPLPPEAQPDPLDALADSMAAVTRTEASAALSRHGPRANAPDAVASLVLGIMSVFVPCLGPGLAIFAIAAGNKAKQAIRRSQWKFAGEGLATAGIVMGIITLCAYAIGTVITIGLDLV